MTRLFNFFKTLFLSKEKRVKAERIKAFKTLIKEQGIQPTAKKVLSYKDLVKMRFKSLRNPKKIKSTRKSRIHSKLSVQFGTFSALKPINMGSGIFRSVRPAYERRMAKLRVGIHVAKP